MANARGDETTERGEQLDVVLLEWLALALNDYGPQRAGFAADGHREEDGKALLPQLLEVLVRGVLLGGIGGDGAQVLDRFTGDALANLEAYLPEHALGKADVAAHDELVAVALEQVERTDLGLEDGRDAARGFVEQRDQRHRAGREGDEVEDGVEPLSAGGVDG